MKSTIKTNISRGPLSRARFTSLFAIAAAGLMLGGLTTATSRAGILYSADGGNIYKFNGAGVRSTFVTGVGGFGLDFDPTGNLYICNFGNNVISKITPGGVVSSFGNTSGLGAFYGLAIDSTGNVFATADGTTIQKFTPGGARSLFASGPNHGLAIDSADNVYAGIFGPNTIQKFTPGGAGSLFGNTGINGPEGLAFDSAGNLYVANRFSNTIEMFTPGGVGSLFADSSDGLSTPIGLAVDEFDNVYVGNSDTGSIQKFTSGGVGSVFASTGYNGSMLAFGPVPEPGTALLLIGSGAMLLLRRRRTAV